MNAETPQGTPRKLIVRLPEGVYNAVEYLGRKAKLTHDDDRIRYAEVARLLLVNEILHDQPVDVRIAAAVLVNSTMILSAEFARLTYDLQDDLARLAVRAAESDTGRLAKVRRDSPNSPRTRGRDVQPVIHLTLDGWLAREVAARAREIGDMRGSGYRSPTAYVVSRMLRDSMDDADVGVALVEGYADAIGSVRTALVQAVAGQQAAIRRRLRTG